MADNTMRIASYNIRKARGLDNRRVPTRILDVINGLRADVVVLQEADMRFGDRPPAIPRDLIGSRTDLELVEVSENGTSLGWHGNAILKRPEIEIKQIDRIALPGLEPRGAVLLQLGISGGVTVVGAHLGLRRRDRRRQLTEIHRLMSASPHSILAGDFNEWSNRKGLEPLELGYVVHAPGRSFHSRQPVAALDRFALSDGVELQSGGVDDGALARRASDHLPVWVDVEIPG